MLHRDLRPANVLVTDNGMLKVADFGTSRFLEIAAHGTTVIGSPPYMAPEQFHGKAVFACDIYSLGVTMYQMLTGVLPYDTPAPADLDRLMSGELVTPPRLKNPAIPKAINDIVMRAMAPDVTARYQRAADLLDDVLAARDAERGAAAARRRRRRTRPPATATTRRSIQSPAAGARDAAGAVLLALPQAAARAHAIAARSAAKRSRPIAAAVRGPDRRANIRIRGADTGSAPHLALARASPHVGSIQGVA